MSKGSRPGENLRTAEIADLFANAVDLHQRGRLQEAEQHYRQILARAPNHADSLHLLGVLAHQVGRNNLAVDLIGKALAINDRVPEFHYNIGLAHGALGQFGEAAAHNRRAIVLNPNHAEAHLNLGNALKAKGHRDEALVTYQRAIALRPSPEAHYNLANVLAELGRIDEAVAHYRHALAQRPDYAEAYNNLGLVLTARGALSEAASSFQRALALKPGLLDAAGLAHVLIGLGDLDNALKTTKRLHDAGETAETRALFFLCLRDSRAAPFAAAYRREIIRALSEPWGNSRYLSFVTGRVLKSDPVIGPIIERAQRGPISADDIGALARDELLRAGLESTQLGGVAVERLLTGLRKAVLESPRERPGDAIALACSLARQCFINDYVFAGSAEETAQVGALRERVAAAVTSGQAIEPGALASVACYGPLHALPNADRLLVREWPAAVFALLTQQIAEPREEARLRNSIPRLTGIHDTVSVAVRRNTSRTPIRAGPRPPLSSRRSRSTPSLRSSSRSRGSHH